MNYQLKDKVAIVCGAGAPGDGIGNGRAAAILLARLGCKVAVVDREGESAEKTALMIREEGGTSLRIEADVTSRDDCERIVRATTERYLGIDLLVNNVGVGSQGSVVAEDPDRWDRVMQINVKSVFWMSRFAIPEMIKRGGGAIVNVSSISAFRPRGLTAYSTSKGAVIAMTRAMAVDHAQHGIRVNCVAPGPVHTPRIEAYGLGEEHRRLRKEASPLKIEGTGWDVGNTVAFLLSNASRYITGQTIVVDGGVSLVAAER